MNPFINTITSAEVHERDRSFGSLSQEMSTSELLDHLKGLDQFRRTSGNLYESVRATLFLYEAYRFVLQDAGNLPPVGKLPFDGYKDLLDRRFEEAIDCFLAEIEKDGLNGTLASGLAEAYHHLTFQLLANQVRKSVRTSKGNRWMFRLGHLEELPIRIHPRIMARETGEPLYPVLEEKTSVRMDLTHSGWSDIFFLGMDYPEGARVINVSVNLGVYGRDNQVSPPIASYFRVIEEPLIRLTSVDLKATKDIRTLDDLFNFGNDYLGLLKAGVIASGIIPPAFEGTHQSLPDILRKIVGQGMGFELVTKVNDIPKGSRLAVSTNLLGSVISLLMRVTHQTQNLEGPLLEEERRLVASRAILGEWIGGSGGGWQDSGGVWPGIKVIKGALAQSGDPEYGISNGCLLPRHTVLEGAEIHPEIDQRLSESLVIMHGGMAQNVGPILEMVTEKYLLRHDKEWQARQDIRAIFDNILDALREGDIKKLAANTQRNWDGPIKTIIPWASTHFTERIIEKAKEKLGTAYWGFLMMGGMSGGGMGIFVDPENYAEHRDTILDILRTTKAELSTSAAFAMEPVVYDFEINHKGSYAYFHSGGQALMPPEYYRLLMPQNVHQTERLPDIRKFEFNHFTHTAAAGHDQLLPLMMSHLFKVSQADLGAAQTEQDRLANHIKAQNGFDFIQHERLRKELIKGQIGLSRNRLPAQTQIEDVGPEDVSFWEKSAELEQLGLEAISAGKVGVLTLAGGVGSRWTKGAGVIKALNAFAEFEGKHRGFLEIHLNKTKQCSKQFGASIPHMIATSHLTHQAIADALETNAQFGYEGNVYLSPGRSIGQRFIPMERDLRFLWEEMPQETLDENKQKVQAAVRSALIGWAKGKVEGSDYVDNLAGQRFSPLGHWYEFSNLLRNGVLAKVLEDHPGLEVLMLHNVDTLGANIDAKALGVHLSKEHMLTYEVIPRRFEDRGGGLAKINGKVRILEGLAQPREEDELKLSYYNSMTTWIQIDTLLTVFGLSRADLGNTDKVDAAVRQMAQRMPTYVTIKDVKYRWGNGQEDIYPVAQVEKLWSDMTALNTVNCGFIVVPRKRGQQLKSPDQLDAWANDGSKDHVKAICGWGQ